MKRIACCLVIVVSGCSGSSGRPAVTATHKDDMPLAAFIAQLPTTPTTTTANCELSGIYRYKSTSKTHYSVHVISETTSLHAYVPIESDVGRKLHELLKDGQRHRLVVTLHHVDVLSGKPIDDRSIRDCVLTAVAAP